MKLKIFIFLCFFLGKGFAQTDSVLNFFPLHNGDLHQFLYQDYGETCYPESLTVFSSYQEEKVLGDTLLPTGYTYKTIISNIYMEQPLYYLRVDTPTANVYRYESYPYPHDVLLDSLRAEVGDSYISEGGTIIECIGADTVNVFGIPRLVKHFHVNFIPGAEYNLAYGLGRIELLNYRDDACYPVLDYIYDDLVYSKIDGREYGNYTNVVEQRKLGPFMFELGQNYPNPFNPSTTIQYEIPKSGMVIIKVYDVIGREVKTLVNQYQNIGMHEINFNAGNLSSGVYYYQLRAGNFISTKKMILLK